MEAPRQKNSALQSLIAQKILVKADQYMGADDLAAIAAAGWSRMVNAVAPLIGTRGAQVLYLHSLHLTSATHPCLAAADAGPDEAAFDKLKTQLAKCEPREAIAASNALFIHFIDLLATLISEPLTEQLLQKAWQDVSPAQSNRREADHYEQ